MVPFCVEVLVGGRVMIVVVDVAGRDALLIAKSWLSLWLLDAIEAVELLWDAVLTSPGWVGKE